jgi:hypothetical protein
MFQIAHLELGNDGTVIARQPLQPPYELWEDAMAIAQFDASRCTGEYDYDNEHECWRATDSDHSYRFVVEAIAPQDRLDPGFVPRANDARRLARRHR